MVRTIPPAWLSMTIAKISLRNARDVKRARTSAIHSFERLENRITPTTLSLPATQDDTLYSESGDLSNGAGQYLYAGQVAASPPERGNSADRRAVIEFNVASIATSLPAGSTINSVTLVLHLSKSADKTNAHDVGVHELTTAWTEGASNAGAGGVGPSEGDGIQAKTGDATWTYSSYKTAQWQSAGGDYVAAATDTQNVGPFNKSLEMSSTNKTQGNLYRWNVTSDVMQMLLHPAANDGWILIGDEGSLSSMQFDSRQVQAPPAGSGIADIAPQLVIDYNTPPSISQTSLPPWTAGRPYSRVIQASGGTGSYTFSTRGPSTGWFSLRTGRFRELPPAPALFS